MVDINKIVLKHAPKQSVQKIDDIQNLFEVINSLLEETKLFEREMLSQRGEGREETLTASSLPEIAVSELGWAALSTDQGEGIPSEQRAELANFLDNIAQGQDLQDKIKKLSDFYDMDKQVIENLTSGGEAQKIKKTLAYLTFYKTLTKIITNFNASAAGFAFESFLGVLLGGNQIATGNKTIADLTSGDGTPISLKLYAEKTVHVGGSYTDLINDLVKEPNLMQYVVTMKDLEGEGLNLEGALKFYRFNFTLDNIFGILGRSREPYVVALPTAFVEDPESFTIDLPELMTAQSAETQFMENFKNYITSITGEEDWDQSVVKFAQDSGNLEKLFQTINYSKNKQIFSAPKRPGFSKISVGQGGRWWRPNRRAPLIQLLSQFSEQNGYQIQNNQDENYLDVADLFAVIYKANQQVQEKNQEAFDERRALARRATAQGFESVYRSAEFYDTLTPAQKKMALRVSRGYIYTDQFSMNKNDVLTVPDSALPEGQESVKIGEIEIGASKIQFMLNNVRDIINNSIFEIFDSLKVLTTNIQGYFAGGLEDDSLADNAIKASAEIGEKTEKIKATGD